MTVRSPWLLAMVLALSSEASTGLAAAPLPASKPTTTGTTTDGNQVTISGDSFTVDDVKHIATFVGHVVTLQSAVTVNSDKVVTTYGKGTGDLNTFTASGNVKLITPDQVATGEIAVFNPKTHLLTLTGNVVVTNKSGQVQSTQLVVNLKTKVSTFTTTGGRVTGVFSSQQ